MARMHGSTKRARRRAPLRRVTATAIAVLATVALVGCSGSAPTADLDAAAATERYQPAVDDLVAALTAAYPTVTWTADSETRVTGDGSASGCVLALGSMRADPSLPDTAGTWADVLTTANPVLTEHGFAAVTDEDSLDGGWSGVSTRDDAGAELRLADKAYTLLSLSVPVTDTDC